MSDEDRLRARLRDRVDAVPFGADLDDVAARIHGRRHGHARALAMVSVVALVAGTVGGFAIGRAGRGTTRGIVTTGASSAAANAVGALAQDISKGRGVAPTPAKRLFVRTTPDGVTIRAYEVTLLERHGEKSTPLFMAVEAEMSTDAAVTLMTSGWSGPATLALGGMTPGSFGQPEHAVTQYVIVQVRREVARVRVSFGDGGSDEMQPQHGVAVLAHLGAAPAVTVSALDAKGHVTFTEPVPTADCSFGCASASTIPKGGGPQPVSGPSLPPPGVDQPSDASAAAQAVSAAVAGAFDGAASDATRVRSVVGGAALVSVFEQLRHGEFAASVQSATTVVEGVVFLSPTTARLKFHSHLGSGTDSGPYLADALLTSSGWQLTRASYCQLAAVAGAPCP